MTRMFPPTPPQKTGRGGGKGECDYCNKVLPVMHIRVPIKGTNRTEFKMCCEECLRDVPEWEYDEEWSNKFLKDQREALTDSPGFQELVQNLTKSVMDFLGDAEPDEIMITFDEEEGRLIKEWIIPGTPDGVIDTHTIEIDDDSSGFIFQDSEEEE